MINCKSLMVKTLTTNAFFLSLVDTASLEVITGLDNIRDPKYNVKG